MFTFGETAVADFGGGGLRYYFTSAPPAQLLERYTHLTGRAPLPPRWALGYHQSKWGYRTEEKVREEAKAFAAHNLPLSAIHLDIDCQVGNRAFTIDPDRFPKLESFTQELKELGVQFIAIINPGIKYSRQSNLFLEGQLLDGLPGSKRLRRTSRLAIRFLISDTSIELFLWKSINMSTTSCTMGTAK